MATAAQEIAALPEGGFVYEPRSFWDVKTVQLSTQKQTLRFDRDHFTNGGRYPITITRIALAGINYAYRKTPAAGGAAWQSTNALLRAAEIALSAPFRQHYIKKPIPMAALARIATQMPAPRPIGAGQKIVIPSSTWGVVGLKFDKPLIVPRGMGVEWSISTCNGWQEDIDLNVAATMLYEEAGGLWPGSARSHGPFSLVELNTDFPALPPTSLEQGWPYVIDAFADPNFAGGTPQFWHPAGAFTATKYKQQEATKSGSTMSTWMRVHLNQIDMDNTLGLTANGNGTPIAQACMRIGTRAKTEMVGDNWFREGAPLCLVFDTITPALVYKLPVPITLTTGDSLDVQLQLPGFSGVSVDPLDNSMNVGIAFNGYAAIKG